jgi:hypothetical protein
MSLANASKLIGVLVALIFIVCKAPVIWHTKPTPDKRLLSTWLFGLTITLALLFQIDQVFMLIGHISHIPNLSWLLSSSFLSLAYYFLVISSFSIFEFDSDFYSRYARIFLVHLIAFLLAYVFIFFAGSVAYASPYAGHNIPRSPGELIFANTFYCYTLSLMPIPLSFSLKLIIHEKGEIKVRMTPMLVATLSLTILTLLKIGTSLTGYYFPSSVPDSLFQVINILLLVSSVTWPCIFLPSGYYHAAIKFHDFVGSLIDLFFLTYLCRKIGRSCPPPLNPTPWWSRLRHPLLHIYEAIISIQEVKIVNIPANPQLHSPEFVVARLHKIDDGSLVDEKLVATYVKISQKLLMRELVEKLSPFSSIKATD